MGHERSGQPDAEHVRVTSRSGNQYRESGPEREIEGRHLKEGINHFGFEVESVEAVMPVCRELGAAKPVTRRPPDREAEYRVHDPDGNPVDLSQHGWPH